MKCRPHLTRSSPGTTQPGSTKSSDGHGPTARGQRSGFAVCQHLTPEALRGGCLPGLHRLGPPRRCAGCSPEGGSLTTAETPVWGPGCRGGLPGPHSTRLLVCQAPPTPSCGHAQHVREPPPLSRCPCQGDVATSRGPPGATEAGRCSLRASRMSQACWLFDFRLLAPDRETIVSC